jgi:hypothetical protein
VKEPRRLVILTTILLVLGVAIFSQRNGETELGVDGSYYFQVARHVALGHGLVTSVCLYHQGLKHLPAKTNIYPLWPLLLGDAGRLIGVTAAARFLPRALFLIDLVLLYFLTLRIDAMSFRGFDIGHLVVLLFGCNALFFSAASYPYTEALAFLLIFAALLMIERSGAAAGALAGLAFLTRSQNIVFAAALFAALLIVRRWRSAAAFAAAFVAILLPWVIFLATFVKPFTPSALVSMYSETPQLPVFVQLIHSTGLAWIVDRLRGLITAFNPASGVSFVHSFGLAALLVPIAAVHAVWRPASSPARRRAARPPLHVLATLLAGAALSFSLIFVHQRFFLEWLFGYRHGLPFILLMMLAVIELIARGGLPMRILAVTISIVSIVTGALTIARTSIWHPHPWPPTAEVQLTSWLARNDPNAIVLSTNAQVLAAISGSNFRWAACQEEPDAIRLLLRLVRTDYVAAYDGEQQCPFLNGLVGRELQIIAIFGTFPRRLFLMRVRPPTPTSSAPPSAQGG